MALIIGAVGKPCAGKGTVGKLIKEILEEEIRPAPRFISVRFSDTLRLLAEERGFPKDRDVLQKLGQKMEREGIAEGEGPGRLSRITRQRIEKIASQAEVVYVDGVRWFTDQEMIRSAFDTNILLYVKRNWWKRFKACRKRDENTGDKTKTLWQFLKEDNAPTERFIRKIGGDADWIIDNNGDMALLRFQVHCLCRHIHSRIHI